MTPFIQFDNKMVTSKTWPEEKLRVAGEVIDPKTVGKIYEYRKMPLPELLDLSVNETLARTVMTSLTLLVALVPLLIYGPASLFGMVAAITLGLFVGTYSSVYMAAPILIWLG